MDYNPCGGTRSVTVSGLMCVGRKHCEGDWWYKYHPPLVCGITAFVPLHCIRKTTYFPSISLYSRAYQQTVRYKTCAVTAFAGLACTFCCIIPSSTCVILRCQFFHKLVDADRGNGYVHVYSHVIVHSGAELSYTKLDFYVFMS